MPRPVYKRVRSATESDGIFRTLSAPPFGSGSMAGFWTYEEIKMKLDDLVASDVNDVVDTDAVERAVAKDEDAVNLAVRQFENDDGGFMAIGFSCDDSFLFQSREPSVRSGCRGKSDWRRSQLCQ